MTKQIAKLFTAPINTTIANIARADKKAEGVTAAALPALREACAGWTREEVKAAVLAPYASGRGIKLNETSTGALRWPSDVDGVDAAKKGCNRLIAAILGATDGEEKVEIEIPAHIQKLAGALAKACVAYENARVLGNKALSVALSNLK